LGGRTDYRGKGLLLTADHMADVALTDRRHLPALRNRVTLNGSRPPR
jgi:hypothetical protein